MDAELRKVERVDDALAHMVAMFRVELRALRGRTGAPDDEAGRMEMEQYIDAGLPVYAAMMDGEYAGYVVCRIADGVVWVESIYVRPEYRRRGVASALHQRAESIADACGDDTVYNYVHPNNHLMIAFLRRRGYTVLNLIELRKPHRGEHCDGIITVGEHEFDY